MSMDLATGETTGYGLLPVVGSAAEADSATVPLAAAIILSIDGG